MSKPKKSNNILYIALGVVVVAAAALNMGGDPPKPAKTKTTPTKQSVTKSLTGNTKSEVTLEDEDTTKTFPPFKDKLKDAYKPIIARSAILGSADGGPSNQIPASYADGETGWTYTGNATYDGKTQALIENATGNQGVFLTAGEHWKGLVCNAIKEDGLVVTGPDGDSKTIALLTNTKEKDDGGLAPLNPTALTGAIGVLPDPAATTGRRGRRRNRAAAQDGSAAPAAAPAPDDSGN